jgi:hypothetical protein
LEAPLRSEGKESSLTLNLQLLSIGDDLDVIDGLAKETIRGTENLDWADEIKFVDWRHDDDDDAPSLEARTSTRTDGRPGLRHSEVNMEWETVRGKREARFWREVSDFCRWRAVPCH